MTAGFLFFLSLFCSFSLAAEEPDSGSMPCMVETSLWMIANLLPDPPDFYQLCLGYQLDEKNSIFLNGITWKYSAPLGIPMWDPSFGSPDEEYPGFVRGFGLGVGYQRFVWKGLFASLYAVPFMQNFYTSDDQRIQSGFQLYLQAQLGYQINFLHGRFFIKPAIYMNYWPINTNFPDAFQQKENNWPNYQPFEPHLNIGFRF
ncbi:MAG: hypothetical protein CVV51_03490 [Spirochaetae bacterium HGW-Spirochaetae-7]|jgi:hypothetical protein|nr:MAG: hypothetical protein CVV51_03490 [Spirochaetae bacterium HGW-Spirochaetae-7]